MTQSEPPAPRYLVGIVAPLAIPVFRRVWAASILSNLGQQMLAVTAAWMMMGMQVSPQLVAAVQTAIMMPVMLLALPAGAVADIYDKRKSAICAMLVAICGALYLFAVSSAGLLTPWLLLAGCFVVGSGVALFSPAWQASVNDQVGREALPAAVALYSVSANLARSVGPAIGGLLIASTSGASSFAITAILYVPIIIALASWRRKTAPPRLPPEGVARAVRAGVRYVRYSGTIRRLFFRATLAALGASAFYALLPLVARDRLEAGAEVYGILLGAFGVGAVSATAMVKRAIDHLTPSRAAIVYTIATGAALALLALGQSLWLAVPAACVAGHAWLLTTSLFSIAIQTSAPQWVAGRALAGFQAAVAGGLAAGAVLWGTLASEIGLVPTLLAATTLLLLSPIAELFAPMPAMPDQDTESVPARVEPNISIDISGRSGPIVLEVEYRVSPGDARRFYGLMHRQQRMLERNGAYDVSLARDLADPGIWMRRLHYPTWYDYLRARDRPTRFERELTEAAVALLLPGTTPIVRRWLERPFGSVRWTDHSPRGTSSFPTGTI